MDLVLHPGNHYLDGVLVSDNDRNISPIPLVPHWFGPDLADLPRSIHRAAHRLNKRWGAGEPAVIDARRADDARSPGFVRDRSNR